MNAWPAWQMRDRYQRRIRRARLSVDALAPARRLAFTIEEALRLASLPGENEGRCYYFRALRISGLPTNGNRQSWLTTFQFALEQQARSAVHGSDAGATASNAVFFQNEQEALEILLHRVVGGRPMQEWYWPMVIRESREGADESDPDASVIRTIIERLRAQPASWIGVATALFASPLFDVRGLCERLPLPHVNAWLAEMDGPPRVQTSAAVRISGVAIPAVVRAMHLFGSSSAYTVWLAALGVLLDSPAGLVDGTGVERARIAFRRLAWEAQSSSLQRELRLEDDTALGLAAANTDSLSPRNVLSQSSEKPKAAGSIIPGKPALSGQSAEIHESKPEPRVGFRKQIVSAPLSAESSSRVSEAFKSPVPERAAITEPFPPTDLPNPATLTRWYCEGSPTQAAGFFFLLNALHRIGIVQALAGGWAVATGDFVPRLMLDLAARARISADDPIRQWLNSLASELPHEDDVFPCDVTCWPLNLCSVREAADGYYLRRVWCLAVRRWCWRAARMSLPEIVTRPGVFSVNRTDLNVSMLLESADVRIRKAGLDLNPGWLPWFGRVVHFHYLLPGELYV
jgi:hypothetical protein